MSSHRRRSDPAAGPPPFDFSSVFLSSPSLARSCTKSNADFVDYPRYPRRGQWIWLIADTPSFHNAEPHPEIYFDLRIRVGANAEIAKLPPPWLLPVLALINRGAFSFSVLGSLLAARHEVNKRRARRQEDSGVRSPYQLSWEERVQLEALQTSLLKCHCI